MAKVTSLLTRILTLVFFAFSWTRVAVSRILPFSQPAEQPPTVKVFALTEAEWAELRAGGDVAGQEKSEPKRPDAQQDKPKSDNEAEDPSKAEDKKDQAKGTDCDKAAPKTGEDKDSPSGQDKKKEAPKPGECEQGPGGGDGDMGGTGG